MELEARPQVGIQTLVDWEKKYTEDMEQKEDELINLRYRVLGVSELAKHLEEKKDQLQLAKQKISRLEIALVRVENRASSLEKRLKASSENSSSGKNSAPAQIPGPSRQILDTLMAENNKLKSALNNLTNKGHSGYVTAVKIDQLEDVIERQQVQIEEQKKEINLIRSEASNESSPSSNRENVSLQLQLKKLLRSVKMKDEFCSVLSSELKKVQEELHVAKEQKAQDVPDNSKESGYWSSEHSAVQESSHDQDWETKYVQLQETVANSRRDHRSREQRLLKLVADKQDLLNKESRMRQELETDQVRLQQEVEELSKQQHHSVEADKKHLQDTVDDQLREMESFQAEIARQAAENKRLQGSVNSLTTGVSGGGAEPQLQYQFDQLQHELEVAKNEATSICIVRDKLQDQNEEFHEHNTYLQDRIKQEESARRTLEARNKSQELNLRDLSGQLAAQSGGLRSGSALYSPRGCYEPRDRNLFNRQMPQEEFVRDGSVREQPGNQSDPSAHCGTNIVEPVRRSLGMSRGLPPPRIPMGGSHMISGTQPPHNYYNYQQPAPSNNPRMGGPSYYTGAMPQYTPQHPPPPQQPPQQRLYHQYGGHHGLPHPSTSPDPN